MDFIKYEMGKYKGVNKIGYNDIIMKNKYTYIESGIEWLGEIPTHWDITTLKNRCEIIPSNVDKKSHDDETPVMLCNYVDVYYNEFIDNSVKFMNATANENEINKYQLLLNDVLITKDSEDPFDIAVPALIKESKDKLLCGYHLSILRPKNGGFDGQYLFWVLNDSSISTQFHREATGITRWAIASRHVKNGIIPLPPLSEQKAIADYLDKSTLKIDRIIELKEKQVKITNLFRKNRINEVVRFGLNNSSERNSIDFEYLPEIKHGWENDRFKDVARLRIEKTAEKSPEFDYLELEDLDQETGLLLNKRDTLDVESKVTLFCKGDVLFGKLRPYLEKYHFAEFDGKCTGEILVFNPVRIEGKYLKYLVASNWFISLCNSMSYGAKMPRVSWHKQLAKINFPLPPKNEQKAIAYYLDKLCEKTEAVKEKTDTQIEILKKYRKSLIHEYVTGKMQVYHEN